MDKALLVVEKYFDTDVTDFESAMDVLLDNDVDPEIARFIAQTMFP
jgi:hypothetical protein